MKTSNKRSSIGGNSTTVVIGTFWSKGIIQFFLPSPRFLLCLSILSLIQRSSSPLFFAKAFGSSHKPIIMSPPFLTDTTKTKTALLASAHPKTSPREAPISNQVTVLLKEATELFESTFGVSSNDDDDDDDDNSFPLYCSMAPGRVNLIGEHVDYTGGFVFPMAIGYSTLCYGRGKLVPKNSNSDDISVVRECRVISSMQKDTVSFSPITDSERSSLETYDLKSPHAWANYVIGVVNNYLPDLSSTGLVFCFDVAIAGDVPLGSGLSSSASLEVSVARFLECILDAHHDNELAFSSSQDVMSEYDGDIGKARAIQRALRCQHAERTYCGTPCGIMDQFVSSAAKQGSVLLIDCEAVDYEEVTIGGDADTQPPTAEEDNLPVVIVCNSNVKHDNAGGEYPIRVKQCDDALTALQAVNPDIISLRKATLPNVEAAKSQIDDVTYRRAKHVVTENERTIQAKTALSTGDFATMGQLMNASHKSMKDDYEVSCDEIDILVELAQGYNGVYGSRLTGGGFGGCTVSLVERTAAEGLMTYLKAEYKKKTNLECTCFETMPEGGARSIPVEAVN